MGFLEVDRWGKEDCRREIREEESHLEENQEEDRANRCDDAG